MAPPPPLSHPSSNKTSTAGKATSPSRLSRAAHSPKPVASREQATSASAPQARAPPSPFYSTGGINLTSGCFAIGSTCLPTLTNTNTWTALQTLQQGLISQASSTFTGFTQLTNPSTTIFTNTGNTYLTGLTSALLATDNNGKIVSTTTIGTNLLSANSVTVTAGSGLSGGGEVALGGTITLTNPWDWTITSYGESTSTLINFTGGFLSASSTITSGLFTMSGGASTTNLTASGTGFFATASTSNLTISNIQNSLLATNGIGVVAATTSIGANLIGGQLADSQIASASIWHGQLGSTTISSLTPNYIPKWNGTTFTFNNSSIFDTGNVGIGTTSPYSKLTTWGTGNLFEAVNNASTTVFLIGQSGATSTSFFATTASSTNLFSQIASFGSLTTNTLTTTDLSTFSNGFLSLASSTITSGLFSMNGGASTTIFTNTRNTYLTGPTSAPLPTD